MDSVLSDAAVPFHLLNSYVGLTDSYEKSLQNSKTVKRINETLACNNDYASTLLELERTVRTLELLAEKQNMLTRQKNSPAHQNNNHSHHSYHHSSSSIGKSLMSSPKTPSKAKQSTSPGISNSHSKGK